MLYLLPWPASSEISPKIAWIRASLNHLSFWLQFVPTWPHYHPHHAQKWCANTTMSPARHIAAPEERVPEVHSVWCKSYPQVGPRHRQVHLPDRLSQADRDHPTCTTLRAQRSHLRRSNRSAFLRQKIRKPPRMGHVWTRASRKQALKRSAGRPCQARPGSCTHEMDKLGWWNSRARQRVCPIQLPWRRSQFFGKMPSQRLWP